MAKLFGTNKNLYQYKIDVEVPFDYNLQIAPPYKGTGHASDLFYLFDRPVSHNFDRYLIVKQNFCLHWLDSNFIPKNSKKFEYRNFDKAIRIYIKNEPETRKNEVS